MLDLIENSEKFDSNLVTESNFKKNLNNTYGKTVHSKKSFLCYLVTRLEKDMSKNATQLMKLWIQDTQLELILLKAELTSNTGKAY